MATEAKKNQPTHNVIYVVPGKARKVRRVKGTMAQILKKAPKNVTQINVYTADKTSAKKIKTKVPGQILDGLSAVSGGDSRVPCFQSEKTGRTYCKCASTTAKAKKRAMAPRGAAAQAELYSYGSSVGDIMRRLEEGEVVPQTKKGKKGKKARSNPSQYFDARMNPADYFDARMNPMRRTRRSRHPMLRSWY